MFLLSTNRQFIKTESLKYYWSIHNIELITRRKDKTKSDDEKIKQKLLFPHCKMSNQHY